MNKYANKGGAKAKATARPVGKPAKTEDMPERLREAIGRPKDIVREVAKKQKH